MIVKVFETRIFGIRNYCLANHHNFYPSSVCTSVIINIFHIPLFWFCFQCDLIGRLIELWVTFQSLWQQLFCPNCPHFQAIFVNVPKSFIFLVNSFLGNFKRHLATFYWFHCLFSSSLTYMPLSLYFFLPLSTLTSSLSIFLSVSISPSLFHSLFTSVSLLLLLLAFSVSLSLYYYIFIFLHRYYCPHAVNLMVSLIRIVSLSLSIKLQKAMKQNLFTLDIKEIHLDY